MKITAELELEQWNFLLEVLSLTDKPTISATAINMLKPQLDEQFKKNSEASQIVDNKIGG